MTNLCEQANKQLRRDHWTMQNKGLHNRKRPAITEVAEFAWISRKDGFEAEGAELTVLAVDCRWQDRL